MEMVEVETQGKEEKEEVEKHAQLTRLQCIRIIDQWENIQNLELISCTFKYLEYDKVAFQISKEMLDFYIL